MTMFSIVLVYVLVLGIRVQPLMSLLTLRYCNGLFMSTLSILHPTIQYLTCFTSEIDFSE